MPVSVWDLPRTDPELLLNEHFGFDVGLKYATYGDVSKHHYDKSVFMTSFDIFAGFNVKF